MSGIKPDSAVVFGILAEMSFVFEVVVWFVFMQNVLLNGLRKQEDVYNMHTVYSVISRVGDFFYFFLLNSKI